MAKDTTSKSSAPGQDRQGDTCGSVPESRVGLYLHIPFCSNKCAYCDFCSFAGRESLHAPYLAALAREMAAYAGQTRARTLYVGGGTPTTLPVEALVSLVEKARHAFALLPNAEITVEANPGTIDAGALNRLRQGGVNRLSLGVQSLNDGLLRLLGRIHNAAEAERAVRDARAAGFDNLNLDLMLGLPRQSLADWQESLERALEWGPEHLSLYALTVEEGTPLAAQIERGDLEEVDDDRAADMYEWAEERLEDAGYLHYEISNWARPGCESRHNLVYWRNQPYLGFGVAAHSWWGGFRWANVDDPAAYIARLEAPLDFGFGDLRFGDLSCRPAAIEVQTIDRRTEMSETMMMGLRLLREGVPEARFRGRFGVSMDEVYSNEIDAAIAEGLLERATSEGQPCVRLTRRGHLLGNRVFERFVGE
jgi:oxygen-independent coproporphyrinogen-3 oxidase